MGIRAAAAVALGRAARWGGETFMHRSAGNIPGAMALKVDPTVLVDLAKKVNPVAVISGTNGKTTTTNLVADCLQTAGVPLYCNREGNNLQSGIVTSLMLAPDTSKVVDAASAAHAPVGCFECDEMYTKYVLPRLRPHYFMLLNLFRDQLDRFGEIDRIQATMVFEKIREIIAEQTGKDVDEITLETNVKEDLDADSLDLFQIINDIEDEFDVSVEDPESIVTVQDAVDFVESHKN